MLNQDPNNIAVAVFPHCSILHLSKVNYVITALVLPECGHIKMLKCWKILEFSCKHGIFHIGFIYILAAYSYPVQSRWAC